MFTWLRDCVCELIYICVGVGVLLSVCLLMWLAVRVDVGSRACAIGWLRGWCVNCWIWWLHCGLWVGVVACVVL